MSLLHATKLTAASFGVFSALCWALSAMAQGRLVRRLLPWMPDHGVPYFISTMNAWAAGTASIAAFAQVFLTLRD